MRRAAVFAHYDKDNLIDEYVIYYLKALKELVQELVFISCNELPENEKNKLSGIADFVISEVHDEYDFGSYKRGYLYLKSHINEYDELIFANDSCFGPLYNLKDVFDDMEVLNDCDFWGITKNRFGLKPNGDKGYKAIERPHLQSYFLVFNKNVFTSDVFDKFMNSIKHYDCKNEIVINCEIGLYEILTNDGFSSQAYIRSLYRFNHILISFWRLLIEKYKMPFVKCSVLRLQNRNLTTIANWRECISKNTNYPINLILNNQMRFFTDDKNIRFIPAWLKIIYFYFLGVQPGITKKYLSRLNSFFMKMYLRIFTF